MLGKALLSASVSAAPKVYVEDVFSTFLYTGNGSTQTITNGIDLSGKGGMIWQKVRSATQDHAIWSSGLLGYDLQNFGAYLNSNNANAASQYYNAQTTSFPQVSSTGFTPGFLNTNGVTYASWTFRKAPKFFDIVTYTGNGSNRTIAHNLGSVPGSIIVKRTDTAADWAVYHRSLANTQYLVLNSTAAAATGATRWNSTTPTSSVFSVGTDASVNASGGTYVAYLFAHDAGGFGTAGTDNVVSCGSYTGNGSATGPTVTLSWEPQWVMIKRTDITGDWQLIDNMRGFVVGGNDAELNPNLSAAESTGTFVTPLATGFQLNTTDAGYNASGGTYIYIVIRRGPMKTPTDATTVFGLVTFINGSTLVWGNYDSVNAVRSAYADLVLAGHRSGNAKNLQVADRLRGFMESSYLGSELATTPTLSTSSSSAEATTGNLIFRRNDLGGSPTMLMLTFVSGITTISYAFRRAPGFFDVVAYTGNYVDGRTLDHNLNAVPELMIVKGRGANTNPGWYIYHKDVFIPGSPYDQYLNFTSDAASTTSSTLYWNQTRPTASVFTLGGGNSVNQTGYNYIAYLFATLTGISKVGSYTGTGTTKQIDCGFTAGARFVLIKRTDSTGDWYVWDTARGIISGNDPFLLINSTAAENTSTDYIDPLSSGFEISSTAPAAINANGGSFIFFAVA